MTTRGSQTYVAFCALLAFASADPASHRPRTIHPRKGASAEELEALAKVTEEDARKSALASLKDRSKATVEESELEAEHGCLVYSVDIEIAGTKGIREVQVDAGDARALSSEHESAKDENAEKARDRAKP